MAEDKTATQLGELAEVIIERFARDQEDSSLEKLREEAGHDPEKASPLAQRNTTYLTGMYSRLDIDSGTRTLDQVNQRDRRDG
jgi:hypothetical protein